MSESSKEERYGIGTLFSRRRPLYLFWKGSDIFRYSFFKNIPPIFFPLGISFVFFPPTILYIYTTRRRLSEEAGTQPYILSTEKKAL